MYGHTYEAQHFSPLKQITRENVGKLLGGDGTAGWSPAKPKPFRWSRTASRPRLIGGRLRLVDGRSNGDPLWDKSERLQTASPPWRAPGTSPLLDVILNTAPEGTSSD